MTAETMTTLKFGPYRDAEGNRTIVTVELTDVDGHARLSFTGEEYEKGRYGGRDGWSGLIGAGQHQGSAPAALKALWDRWHLNDMKAGCEHQEARYRANPAERPTWKNEYTGTSGDTLSAPCSECGYRYGTSWLYESLPDDILDQIIDAAKEPAHA